MAHVQHNIRQVLLVEKNEACDFSHVALANADYADYARSGVGGCDSTAMGDGAVGGGGSSTDMGDSAKQHPAIPGHDGAVGGGGGGEGAGDGAGVAPTLATTDTDTGTMVSAAVPLVVWRGTNLFDDGLVLSLLRHENQVGARLHIVGIHLCRRLSSRYARALLLLCDTVHVSWGRQGGWVSGIKYVCSCQPRQHVGETVMLLWV